MDFCKDINLRYLYFLNETPCFTEGSNEAIGEWFNRSRSFYLVKAAINVITPSKPVLSCHTNQSNCNYGMNDDLPLLGASEVHPPPPIIWITGSDCLALATLFYALWKVWYFCLEFRFIIGINSTQNPMTYKLLLEIMANWLLHRDKPEISLLPEWNLMLYWRQ